MNQHAPLRAVPSPPSGGRVPPHHIEAEAAVLAAVLLEPAALDRVLPLLAADQFYAQAHDRIFQAAIEVSRTGQPVDIVTIAAWLRERGWLDGVGGTGYLALLAGETPSVEHLEAHARLVRAKWRQRQIIAIAHRTASDGYGDVGEVDQWIDSVEQAVHDIARESTDSGPMLARDVMLTAWPALLETATTGTRTVGVSTGLRALDARFAGLMPGQLTVLAARPGMGKSSLAFQIAGHAAEQIARRKVDDGEKQVRIASAIFSLEMQRDEVVCRMACNWGHVDLGRMRDGTMQTADWDQLTTSAGRVASLPLWVDDTPGLSPLELRAKVRRLRSECVRRGIELGLVVVDHLLLMRAPMPPNSTRDQHVGEITRSLKELAKECKVAVLALCQLNRSGEARSVKCKRPQLSDLRDSGNIEQDADNVLFVFRDDYYKPKDAPKDGMAEVIVAKQRSGPDGLAVLRWRGESCAFLDGAS